MNQRLKWICAAVLAAICVIAYDPSRLDNSSGDSISSRYWPVAILKHHTWELTPFKEDFKDVAYSALFSADSKVLFPRIGWGMAAFTVPFYAAVDLFDIGGSEWTHRRISQVSRWNAIALMAGATVGMFLLFLHFVPLGVAFVTAAFFALGTWAWSMGAQGLYSQTAAVFAHVVNLLLLWRVATAPEGKSAYFEGLAVGLCHALIWSVRPQDVLLVAPAFFLFREKRALTPYLITFVGGMLGLMEVYQDIYNSRLGAYGVVEGLQGTTTWHAAGYLGFFGMLFSPNRGAIVFFPLLLGVPFLWARLMPKLRIRETIAGLGVPAAGAKGKAKGPIPESFARVLALGAVTYFTALCFVVYWHGTWAYGPRYLFDLLPYVFPVIALFFNEVFRWFEERKSRLPAWALALGLVASVESVFVHALGHYNYDLYVWNFKMVPVNDEKAWNFHEFMLRDVWEAGSNRNREMDPLERLKKLGY